MALTFGAVTSDAVDIGSGSSIDDLDPFTMVMWCKPTTFTTNRGLYQKFAVGSTNWRLSGTSGDVQLAVSRGTANTSYITNSAPLVLNAWNFIAVTFNSAAGTSIVHVYSGSLTAAAVEATYGTPTDGSGTVTSNATATGKVGNNSTSINAFQGDIAVFAIFNRVLLLSELIDWQFTRRRLSGCVAHHEFGFNGTGTQIDYSGNGNSGTVTGATQATGGHVPLRAPWRQRIQYVPVVPSAGGPTITLGTIAGIATAAVSLHKLGALALQAITGTSAASVALTARRALTVSSSGTATVNTTVQARRAVSALVAGVATVNVILGRSGAMRVDVQGVATVAVLLSALRAVKLVAVQGVATVTTALGKLKGLTVASPAGAATVTVALRARRAITVAVDGSSTVNITANARRAITVSVGGSASVSASLDQQASTTTTTPTGKYKPEHDSAVLDLGAATGFANEHSSAFRDLFDAGG